MAPRARSSVLPSRIGSATNERPATAACSVRQPSEQLDQTDGAPSSSPAVVIKIGAGAEEPARIHRSGGGIVTIHAARGLEGPATGSRRSSAAPGITGGTKWREGPMHLYFTDRENPITKDMSNFAMDDEIYYDMDVAARSAASLAGAYTPKPQRHPQRKGGQARRRDHQGRQGSQHLRHPAAGVDLRRRTPTVPSSAFPATIYANFSRPTSGAMLLRGIAWAGKRENADELCKPDELGDNLRYVEGGPTAPGEGGREDRSASRVQISLVASEPLINKVMNIDWDEKGRLWVCETPEYPEWPPRAERGEVEGLAARWTKKYDRDPDRPHLMARTTRTATA